MAASTPRSARARILGAVVAASALAVTLAGGITFTVQALMLWGADADLSVLLVPMAVYVVASLLVVAVIAAAAWLAVTSAVAPLQNIRKAAGELTVTNLSQRLPATGADGVGDLSQTVNAMLDRIEISVDSQRQLLDDVRHELKTPITIIRGHLEIMDATQPADVDATRAIGLAELDRMNRLVEDIDLLAAVESDTYDKHPVEIRALTERVGERVAVIPGHPWALVETADGTAHADGDRLLQAWLQLADNAAKYSPEGSPIEIGSSAGDDEYLLWVRDHGPGVPPAVRHRIFRRFDRGQRRRSVGGSGLGLAIVDAIAKAHGGRCSIIDTPGGGATFRIHVPHGAATAYPEPVRAGDVIH